MYGKVFNRYFCFLMKIEPIKKSVFFIATDYRRSLPASYENLQILSVPLSVTVSQRDDVRTGLYDSPYGGLDIRIQGLRNQSITESDKNYIGYFPPLPFNENKQVLDL